MRHLYLVLAVVWANIFVIKGYVLFDDDSCGDTMFKNATGVISVQDPGQGKTCSYYIIAGNYTPQVAISFSSVAVNPLPYNLTVYGVNTTGDVNASSVLIANLTQGSQEQSNMKVISRYNITKIVLSRADSGNQSDVVLFTAAYDTTACQFEDQSAGGVIQSPLYLPGNGTVKCSYKETLYQTMGVVSFPIFSLSGGNVMVQFGSGSAVNVTGPVPNDVFGDASASSFSLNFTFNNNNNTAVQNFTAMFQTVDPRCSGVLKVDSTFKQLNIPASNQLPVTCYAQLTVGAEGKVYMENTVNYTQTQGFDNIVFYDGASTQAPVIGTLSDDLPWLVSSKKSLTVVANLGARSSRVSKLQYRSDSYNNYFTLTNESRLVEYDGSTVNNSTVKVMFQSKNPALGAIKIELKNNTSLTEAEITVQCGKGMTMFTFTKDSVLFPIVMPSTRAMVVIKKLKGSQRVSFMATAVTATGCNGLYYGPAGQINFSGASTTEKACNFLVSSDNDVILEVKQVNLCKTGTLDIYQGFNKNAVKYASFKANMTYTIPQIRFPAGSAPRLVWNDNNNTCQGSTVIARYWNQDNSATCGALGAGQSGSVSTPNYPNQYPLNVRCNWTLPTTANASMMYVSVNSLNLQPGHTLTLQNTSAVVANFTGLNGDLIVPNKNLSLIFNASVQGTVQSGQGAQLMYKVLTCGGLVTKYPYNLTAPAAKNQSVDCIWIIQVPLNGTKKSVNIVSANITVAGYTNASSGFLEIHDGSSVRDQSINVNMTQKNKTTIYSRTNFLFVRYTYTNSTNKPFTFNFTYTTFNCNSTSQCDNGVCIHPDWWCNNITECRDGKDEIHCNGTRPIPPAPVPVPSKGDKKTGVASFWVVICLLIGIAIGVVVTIFVPKCIRNVRGRSRTPGSNYGSLHEET